LQAPSVIFDSKDYLHARYLKQFFNITDVELNHPLVPSVAGFVQFALKDYAYALIPAIDIVKELNQKKLINLFPGKTWQMPLYWHSWAIENKSYKSFNDIVLKIARNILRYKT
jgi:LysR family transcriptional regulator, chromosome initiation inhibitor